MLQAYGKNSKLGAQKTRLFVSLTENPAQKPTLELWTWGRGEAGQLGLGKESTERSPSLLISLPQKIRLAPMPGVLNSVEILSSSPVNSEIPVKLGQSQSLEVESAIRKATVVRRDSGETDSTSGEAFEEVGISCGLFHSCFWKNGKLWLWGKGDGGRLGTGSEVSLYSPHLSPFPSRVKSVALGGLHSAAVTEDGYVYTFGFGGFGALGHGSYEKALSPKLVDGSSVGMKDIVHIACGGAHTAAVSASGNMLYLKPLTRCSFSSAGGRYAVTGQKFRVVLR